MGCLEYFLDVIDAEFFGKSWNGPSLTATLDRLSAAEAADDTTWEGYSAWSIALHCAKCKRVVAVDLGVRAPDWDYGEETWFPAPADPSPEAWERDRELLRVMHDLSMGALRSLPEARLADEMPSWKRPWGQVIAWLATHDAFHGAQLRSMGLPALKEKRHE